MGPITDRFVYRYELSKSPGLVCAAWQRKMWTILKAVVLNTNLDKLKLPKQTPKNRDERNDAVRLMSFKSPQKCIYNCSLFYL